MQFPLENLYLLAKRMCLLLPKIILPQQGAFIKGREISDNINLTQEIVKGIDSENNRGKAISRLNMQKVYNRLE